MKTIGILGGMSWESTLQYYRRINEMVNEKMGGFHSARCVINSINFESIIHHQNNENWDQVYSILYKEVLNLENAGVSLMALASNTIHYIADKIQEGTYVPVLHIVDAVAEKIRKDGGKKVGLMGTKFTLGYNFYTERLESYGLEIIKPDEENALNLNEVIFEELCKGIVSEHGQNKVMNIVRDLIDKEADSIILGCTELNELSIPGIIDQCRIYNSLEVHCERIVKESLGIKE